MRFAPPTGRESHFPERKTTLRVTITTARSKFSTRSRFSMGREEEGGALFLSNRVRDEAIFRESFREWKRDSPVFPLSAEKIYLRVWKLDLDYGKR